MPLDLQVTNPLNQDPQPISDQNGTSSGVLITSLPSGKLAFGAPGEWIQNSKDVSSTYGLAFYGEFQERMRLSSGGQLGIGTINPQATLHVKGDVRFEGLPAPPSVPDLGVLLVDIDGKVFAHFYIVPWIEQQQALVEKLQEQLAEVQQRFQRLEASPAAE